MRTIRSVLVVVLLTCVGVGAKGKHTHFQTPPADLWQERAREVVALVRDHFYDGPRAAAWAKDHAEYAQGVRTAQEFTERMKAALAKLKTSHTGYYTPAEVEYYGLLAIFRPALDIPPVEVESVGMDVRQDGFVRVVFPGGPAATAGVRRGDKVLRADGQPFHPILSLQGKAGRPVTLTVQRQQDGPLLNLTVVPRRVDPKQEWLQAQRQSARVIPVNGRQVAYLSFYSCAGQEHADVLQEVMQEQFREADALVLDFRDGWGGCNPALVNLFNTMPPVLTQTGRDGKTHQFDRQWRKPLVLLINEGSRSGKEVVAHALQKHRRATLVGTRTAGAVLGGRCFLLADRSLLYLAVTDVRVDGERLEGQGVPPDVEVKDKLPYANGADPQLDKALDVAGR